MVGRSVDIRRTVGRHPFITGVVSTLHCLSATERVGAEATPTIHPMLTSRGGAHASSIAETEDLRGFAVRGASVQALRRRRRCSAAEGDIGLGEGDDAFLLVAAEEYKRLNVCGNVSTVQQIFVGADIADSRALKTPVLEVNRRCITGLLEMLGPRSNQRVWRDG